MISTDAVLTPRSLRCKRGRAWVAMIRRDTAGAAKAARLSAEGALLCLLASSSLPAAPVPPAARGANNLGPPIASADTRDGGRNSGPAASTESAQKCATHGGA